MQKFERQVNDRTCYMVVCAKESPCCYHVAAAWSPEKAEQRLLTCPKSLAFAKITADTVWQACCKFGWRERKTPEWTPPTDVKIFELRKMGVRVVAVREARDDGNCGFFPSTTPTRKWLKTRPTEWDKNFKTRSPEAKVFAFAGSGSDCEDMDIKKLIRTAVSRLECRPNYVYALSLDDKDTFCIATMDKGIKGPRRNKPRVDQKRQSKWPRELRPMIHADTHVIRERVIDFAAKSAYIHYTVAYQLEGDVAIWYGAAVYRSDRPEMDAKERERGEMIARGRCLKTPALLTLSCLARDLAPMDGKRRFKMFQKYTFYAWERIVERYGCHGSIRYVV